MNPIIYIISPPRARSTIFFRALQAQLENFICYHEPSQNVHNNEKGGDYAAPWFKETAFKSYEDIRSAIIQSSTTNPVLVKEVSFACSNCLTDDFISAKDGQNIYFTFLLRHPLETIASFYKQVHNDMKPFFIEDIGFEGLYNLYNRISKLSPNKPLIIDGLHDPYKAISSVLSYAKIDTPVRLQWDALGDDFNGDIWHEQKKLEHMRYWHKDAINSTCILSTGVAGTCILSTGVAGTCILSTGATGIIKTIDDLINVVESINPSHKEQVIEAYNYNLYFYKQFVTQI